MDFFDVVVWETKYGLEVRPSFINKRSNDLIVRGGKFYAIWNESEGLWSKDEYDVVRIVDEALRARAAELKAQGKDARVMLLERWSTRSLIEFQNYCKAVPDSRIHLDSNLVFLNTPPRKEDYCSRRLPYNIGPGDITAYEKMISTHYASDERHKLEWAVGALIAGDAKNIQKFIVLTGPPRTGKSTFLNILERLFYGYWSVFDAKALTSKQNSFSTAPFFSNPLVGIQHDGDLSRIEDNSLLNSIIGHDNVLINEKYQKAFTVRINTFLFMGTNQDIQITHANSGIIRRLINVVPTGEQVDATEYNEILRRINFELGAIAHHCLEVYRNAGPYCYDNYRPEEQLRRTNPFYNFIQEYREKFQEEDSITLKEAWNLYKDYCEVSGMRAMQMFRVREELKVYFREYHEKTRVSGIEVRSLFRGFKTGKLAFDPQQIKKGPSLVMDETISLLDVMLADCPAQYPNEDGTPAKKWVNVETTLADLDTTKLHYVKVPENHIVIDFDLRGDDGEKSLERNLEAASAWPPTYAELSRSEKGIHLHYIYVGDATQLSRVFDDGIEIKTYPGDSSLRRSLSKCNDIPVADIHDGLPLKEKKNVLDKQQMESEAAIRRLILRNLAKEIHPGTKPSIDFIHKVLEDAYASGVPYDVTNMRQRILAFANNSTNQAEYCLKKVMDMKFSSEAEAPLPPAAEDDRIVFYDVEVFPNLFVLCWKFPGEDASVVSMINPSPAEVEEIARMNLVGFNNRRYDNHILYARVMGYDNEQLFRLSQRLTGDGKDAYFGDAYNMSFADIFDFSSVKKTLKLFQIDLGLTHRELGLPWDQPVPEELWPQVVKYCSNDVITEEQVFENRKQDFVARQMLAALSGLAVNETTYKHTAKIIFGDVKKPQADFVYTDLSKLFPGYQYDFGKSTYKGEIVGEGGYVYAEEGMYTNVAVLDVASMHPTSIRELNLFGPYTENFTALMDARLAIKAGDYNAAKRMLGGKLEPYLGSNEDAAALAYALKIIINTVYGLTSASFDNQFRDIRNKDNIVAKRGALFMITLKNAVQAAGYQVIHIKTDSIKIPDADDAVMELIKKMGEDYGYTFEHEMTYAKFCLVNDAVYIGEAAWDHTQVFTTRWHATGAQFIHPYVFKTLFSKEKLVFLDYCETRSVKGGAYLYLDFGDGPQFVGGAGSFVPVKEGTGGGTLLRGKDDVFHSASGSKGWLWKEAAVVYDLGLEDDIDMSYYRKLVDGAVTAISKFGDYEWFTS